MSRQEWVAFLEINDHPSAACATLRPCARFGLRVLLEVHDTWTNLVNTMASMSFTLRKSRDRSDKEIALE